MTSHLLRLATYPGDPQSETRTGYLGLTGADHVGGANSIQLMDYTPASPPLSVVALSRAPYGEGGEQPYAARQNVSETARVLLMAVSDAGLRDWIEQIEIYFEKAHAYQRGGGGERVYLEWQPGGAGRLARCEILSGRLEWSGGAFDLGWGQRKVSAVLGWTRRAMWEDVAFTTQNLTSPLSVSGTEWAIVQMNPSQNWAAAPAPGAGAYSGGVVFELTLQHKGLAGADDGGTIGRVWCGVRSTPTVGDAPYIDTVATLGTGDQSWTYAAFSDATLDTARGFYRCLAILGGIPPTGGDLRYRGYWEMDGVRGWTGRWVTFPTPTLEATGRVLDLGIVPFPPDPRWGAQTGWAFGIDRYGATVTGTITRVLFLPLDAFANWRYFATNLDYDRYLYDYAEASYDTNLTLRKPLLYRAGGPLVLPSWPTNARFYFQAERDSGEVEDTRRFLVRLRARGRYPTVPGA